MNFVDKIGELNFIEKRRIACTLNAERIKDIFRNNAPFGDIVDTVQFKSAEFPADFALSTPFGNVVAMYEFGFEETARGKDYNGRYTFLLQGRNQEDTTYLSEMVFDHLGNLRSFVKFDSVRIDEGDVPMARRALVCEILWKCSEHLPAVAFNSSST